MRRPARVAALGLAAIAVPTAAVATELADDQTVADAAIEAFTDRVTADGWEAFGPYEVDADGGAIGPQSECQREFTATDLFDLGPFPGETARATSDQFSFDPASSAASPTEPVLPVGEVVVAFVITVDPAHVAELEALVDDVGSPAFAECMDEAFTLQLARPDPDQSDALPMDEALDVDSLADLGVGDASASIRITIDFVLKVPTTEVDPVSYRSETTLHLAVVDRTLVALWTAVTGTCGPCSGFDPIVELGALAASFGD